MDRRRQLSRPPSGGGGTGTWPNMCCFRSWPRPASRLVNVLLETYLGCISGHRVLTGQSARGGIQQIDCALMYSDLARSLKLSQNLGGEDYIALLNTYFDCTAGAALDHGGEVLKFVGDGILAIFPFDDAHAHPRRHVRRRPVGLPRCVRPGRTSWLVPPCHSQARGSILRRCRSTGGSRRAQRLPQEPEVTTLTPGIGAYPANTGSLGDSAIP